MARKRILIAGTSRMLTDIIRNVITCEPDLEIVDEVAGLDRVLREAVPDVVILHLPRSRAIDLLDRLYTRPQARIVAIDPVGRTGELHALRPRVVPLGELSPVSLLAAVRANGALDRPGEA